MIVEVRTFTVTPGRRGRFLEFFARDATPLQRALGMGIVGPFVDLENPDVFIWLRTFPSLEARDRMKRALYEGDAWKNELEEIAMPMLESYQVALTTIPAAFVNDLHGIGESAGLASSPPNGHAATPPLPRT